MSISIRTVPERSNKQEIDLKTATIIQVFQILGFLSVPTVACMTLSLIRRYMPDLVAGKKKNEGLNRLAPGGLLFGFFGACASAVGFSFWISVGFGVLTIAAVLLGEYLMPVPYIDS